MALIGVRTIMRIGAAGENRVAYSAVTAETYRHFGRLGLGAVFGSKMLKAVVIRGKGGVRVADREGFKKLARDMRQEVMNSPFLQAVSTHGSMAATGPYGKFGALPAKNFQSGVIEDWFETRGYKLVERYSDQMIACPACPVGCAHWAVVREGPYAGLQMKGIEVTPVFEIGAKLLVHDLDAILKVVQRLASKDSEARKTIRPEIQYTKAGMMVEFGDRDEYTRRLAVRAPRWPCA